MKFFENSKKIIVFCKGGWVGGGGRVGGGGSG